MATYELSWASVVFLLETPEGERLCEDINKLGVGLLGEFMFSYPKIIEKLTLWNIIILCLTRLIPIFTAIVDFKPSKGLEFHRDLHQSPNISRLPGNSEVCDANILLL